jgi:hypothetical protein
VTATGIVSRHEDVARAYDKSLAVASSKFERAGKRNYELRFRRVMPVEGRMRWRFLEVYGQTSVRRSSVSVPSSTCEALSLPV